MFHANEWALQPVWSRHCIYLQSSIEGYHWRMLTLSLVVFDALSLNIFYNCRCCHLVDLYTLGTPVSEHTVLKAASIAQVPKVHGTNKVAEMWPIPLLLAISKLMEWWLFRCLHPLMWWSARQKSICLPCHDGMTYIDLESQQAMSQWCQIISAKCTKTTQFNSKSLLEKVYSAQWLAFCRSTLCFFWEMFLILFHILFV